MLVTAFCLVVIKGVPTDVLNLAHLIAKSKCRHQNSALTDTLSSCLVISHLRLQVMMDEHNTCYLETDYTTDEINEI